MKQFCSQLATGLTENVLAGVVAGYLCGTAFDALYPSERRLDYAPGGPQQAYGESDQHPRDPRRQSFGGGDGQQGSLPRGRGQQASLAGPRQLSSRPPASQPSPPIVGQPPGGPGPGQPPGIPGPGQPPGIPGPGQPPGIPGPGQPPGVPGPGQPPGGYPAPLPQYFPHGGYTLNVPALIAAGINQFGGVYNPLTGMYDPVLPEGYEGPGSAGYNAGLSGTGILG